MSAMQHSDDAADVRVCAN